MNKEKNFVSAYACEPDKGSEIGVGWHWILEMSKQYDLWVLTRESNKLNIENWISKNPQHNNITFVYYDLPKWMRWWKKGLRGVRTYYCLWQRCTNKLVKKVMVENGIEIYHLLTYGNALWPVSSYGMKQTFVWGPVGGTDTVPAEFSKHYDAKSRVLEWTRRIVVKALPLNIGFRNRCKNAEVILCKSAYMRENILPQYRDKAIVFTDVAVDTDKIKVKTDIEKLPEDKTVKYLAVGRLDAWRGFDILIEAFREASKNNKDISLEILGEGNCRKQLQRQIEKYDLSGKIMLSGQVSEDDYVHKLCSADVVINPALKEGNVTVAFDSIGAGKPLICVDTKGYTTCMGDNAIVIERGNRQKLIDDLAEAVIRTTDINLREYMSASARKLVKQYSWKEKGKSINKVFVVKND